MILFIPSINSFVTLITRLLWNLSGQKKEVTDIAITDPVSKLEAYAAKETKLPQNQLSISYNGKPLKPEKALDQQDVPIGAVLDVVHTSPFVQKYQQSVPLRITMPDSEWHKRG